VDIDLSEFNVVGGASFLLINDVFMSASNMQWRKCVRIIIIIIITIVIAA